MSQYHSLYPFARMDSMTETNRKSIEELVTRGVENIYPSADFLRKKLESGERLTIYHGVDPTGPTLHLGHMIPIRKLALFQKLGHKVIFMLGDFTATIGDPDKISVRKPLTREDVLENARLYKEQASKFISFEGENAADFRSNSEWLDKLTFRDVVGLAQHMTVQQMLERDMFQKRLEEGRPIYLHEFLYPLMQGYDSVALKVDGELGGNDQTFNMLAGRTIAKQLTGTDKFVLAATLLVDPDGAKMGKTTGNMIALTDSPEDMFGKVMSWTDGMIIPGFELCTDLSVEEIEAIKKEIEGGAHPRDIKMRLAYELVKLYHSEAGADSGKAYFETTIQKKEIPDEMPSVAAAGDTVVDALIAAGFAKSKSEARRLIEEGGVSLYATRESGAERVIDPMFVVLEGVMLKVGKHRFARVSVK